MNRNIEKNIDDLSFKRTNTLQRKTVNITRNFNIFHEFLI